MPEELNATMTDDQGGSVAVDDGGSLQEQMTDDFFYDDGSDAVVDSLGNAQTDSEGNIIRTMDDFQKLGKGANNQPDNNQPATGKNNDQQQQSTDTPVVGFDSVFQKDGQFNFDGVVKTSSALKDFSYQMQSTYKNPDPAQGGQPADPVDPKEHIRTTIDGLRKELTTQRLDPINEMYNGIYQVCTKYSQALPQGLWEELRGAISDVYSQRNDEITAEIDRKRDDLIGEAVTAQQEQAKTKEFEKTSAANFKSVANQLIPQSVPEDQREDKLSELVFGHQGQDGKFVRGYGADLIEAFFDTAMAGKTFSSPDEWKQAYNQFWFKFSSDPKNVQLVANLSFARYVASNHDKYRDEYRKSWEKELAAKGKNRNVQSRSGGAIPNDVDSADALVNYHRAPGINR